MGTNIDKLVSRCNERANALFFKQYGRKAVAVPEDDEPWFLALSEAIEQCGGKQEDDLRQHMLSDALDHIVWNWDSYDDIEQLQKLPHMKFILRESSKTDDAYFQSIYYFFRGKNRSCISYLRRFVSEYRKEKDEEWFGLHFLPFKNAYKGFWDSVDRMFREYKLSPDLRILCCAAKAYYTSESNAEAVEVLCSLMQKIPDSPMLNELLGFAYYREGRWQNAAAYLENVKTPYLCSLCDLWFYKGWAYGKCRETLFEIQAYEKCREIDENGAFVLNNLGYSYYKAHQYQKALEIFEICLERKLDLRFSVNNYVSTLIALGQYKKAKQFAKNPPHKIAKYLLEKLKTKPDVNAKQTIPDAPELGETTMQNNRFAVNAGTQFSSERLLEEELEERMNKGLPVFGMNLKMYRRKGIYGRQFIIPEGRLDLLAEDAKGNLYVIELKKDSGYDNAYEQTVRYLESPTMQKLSGKRKLYGIICLNDPSNKLIQAVKKDTRIRLFEYQISYSEVL
ncbi:MAG: DUF91 domain-containing protein [Oscillospiraceae bacterium]|nr:DUF91 domain-containing protein [Oscillospiraceae bacterium]